MLRKNASATCGRFYIRRHSRQQRKARQSVSWLAFVFRAGLSKGCWIGFDELLETLVVRGHFIVANGCGSFGHGAETEGSRFAAAKRTVVAGKTLRKQGQSGVKKQKQMRLPFPFMRSTLNRV